MSTISSLMSTSRFGGYLLCGVVAFAVAAAANKLAQKVHQSIFRSATNNSRLGCWMIGLGAGLLAGSQMNHFLSLKHLAVLSELPSSLTRNYLFSFHHMQRNFCALMSAGLGSTALR